MTDMRYNHALHRLLNKIIDENYPGQQYFTVPQITMLLNELSQATQYVHKGTRKNSQFKEFDNFIMNCFYRNVGNYDSMVLLTSDKGGGKSSFAMMMARRWCQIIGIPFSPERHIAYNNADLMEKIDNLRFFEPIICDESVRFASSEDWNKRENKELKKKLAQVRTKHLFYILCFPLKINKLEKTYLESYVNYWIEIIDRGVGALFVKDKNPYHDSWRLNHFKNIGSWTEFTDLKQVEKKLKKHPNFWQIIRARKPKKELEQRYIKVRERNVYDQEGSWQNNTKQDIVMAMLVRVLYDFVTRDSTLSWKRILLHLQNDYGITVSKKLLDEVLKESKSLVEKTKEEGIKL